MKIMDIKTYETISYHIERHGLTMAQEATLPDWDGRLRIFLQEPFHAIVTVDGDTLTCELWEDREDREPAPVQRLKHSRKISPDLLTKDPERLAKIIEGNLKNDMIHYQTGGAS